jgi:hypothetical protein
MTDSSVQQDYLTISSDSVGMIAQEIGSVIGNITISNNTATSYYYTGANISSSPSTITIGSGLTSSGSVSINTIGVYEWQNFSASEDFVDKLPDLSRIQKMCEEYPGLKIAYEKFVTTYKLVKDHYDTPEDQRPLP